MNKYLKAYHISENKILYGAYWPTIKVNAHILLVTGMEEHAMRYTEFALLLNSLNYDVTTVDYYGQGENINKGISKKGVVPDGAFEMFVDDLGVVAKRIAQDGLPLYIIGHSMGSFLTQRFLQKYSKLVQKAVIVGSNGPNILFGLGNLVAALTVNQKNRDQESKLLASLSVGAYAKSVKDAKTSGDWLSYNEKNVEEFLANPLDGGPSSKGFYRELLRGTSRLYKKRNYKTVRRDLPLFLIAGEDDPVGAHGKGVRNQYKFYKRLGFSDVTLKLYVKMRHEILNEINKEQVFQDVINFLKD